jgi:hypothetical protein
MPRLLCNWLSIAVLAVIVLVADPPTVAAQGRKSPDKEQTPTRILAHYMPWYMAKPFSQVWGWHWTMGVFDPESAKPGQPAIASHYGPLIGPYDSGDPDVLEYHALLMKLAGIDGVVIDWYGTVDLFDYAAIHRNVSAFADVAARTGLEFAVCYEDQTIPKLVEAGRLPAGERVQQARNEIDWIRKNWFARPSYLKVNSRPLLLSFGRDGLTDSEWEQVLAAGTQAPFYLSEHTRRNAAAGAFDWPVPQVGTKVQEAFYRDAPQWPIAMAVAFPRFHDIYEQAKVHKSWGTIDDDGGRTFERTLEQALKSKLPLVQICTWNDWGEGTVIEPSVEFGYRDLEVIQRQRRRLIEPGVAVSPQDLRLPHRLYQLRKDKKRSPPAGELERIAKLLTQRSTKAAREALGAIEMTEQLRPKGGE